MEQIKCSQCGRLYPEDAAFCPSCKYPNKLFLEQEKVDEQEDDECPDEMFTEQEKMDEQEDGENEQVFNNIFYPWTKKERKKQNRDANKVINSSLFSPDAEPILNKYGIAIKFLGLVLMILSFGVALVYLILAIKGGWLYFVGTLKSILIGVIAYIVCIVIKAFIDVFVNISVTLQDIDSKMKHPSDK